MRSFCPSAAIFVLGLAAALSGCASFGTGSHSLQTVSVTSRTDFDSDRSRAIPSLIYAGHADRPRPLALTSHGYGANPEDYAFLAEALARRGYVVASIDHELPDDAPLPSTGDVRRDRTPSWLSSVRSMRLVRDALVADGIARPGPVVLVGHSHGGDASMMMATNHPGEVSAVFSLDNRRYPLPRIPGMRVCSLRSSDQPADPGVLPAMAEAARLGMQISFDPELVHNDMSEAATEPQKERMVAALLRCLD